MDNQFSFCFVWSENMLPKGCWSSVVLNLAFFFNAGLGVAVSSSHQSVSGHGDVEPSLSLRMYILWYPMPSASSSVQLKLSDQTSSHLVFNRCSPFPKLLADADGALGCLKLAPQREAGLAKVQHLSYLHFSKVSNLGLSGRGRRLYLWVSPYHQELASSHPAEVMSSPSQLGAQTVNPSPWGCTSLQGPSVRSKL